MCGISICGSCILLLLALYGLLEADATSLTSCSSASCSPLSSPSSSPPQINHMKRFIEQEAREKAEEIQIKVRWGSNGGHLLEPPTNLVVLFPSHVGEGQVITHYKFVHVVNSIAVIYVPRMVVRIFMVGPYTCLFSGQLQVTM